MCIRDRTGAQAIAGTINIITREGRKGMPTELKVGSSLQGGYASPTASIVKYHDAETWTANYTLSINRYAAPDRSEVDLNRNDGTVRHRVSESHYDREGLHATSRLQLKGDPGETFTLMPFFAFSQGKTPGNMQATESLNDVPIAGSPATATTNNENHFAVARLNGQWKRKLSNDSSMEWKFNVGGWNSHNQYQQTSSSNALLPSLREDSQVKDRSANISAKYTNIMGGGHQWVSGSEFESVRRTQDTVGSYLSAPGKTDYSASTLRYALYTQDEWQLTPNWATHLGARYEGLTTEGSTASGDVTNRNSVFTPLLHAMWRPDPDSRDQVRTSLTRSFKTPTMPSLLARRAYTRDDNSATNPDVSGNPNLKPEIATGLDVAIERYLPQGGVLSASVFHRRVQDLIRNVTSYETSPLNPAQKRWVSRPDNISEAVTEGIELEAKFRMDQWIADAPHIDLRNNVSFYRSRVLSIMGPDNRLDQQPSMTANVGADYKLKSAPLTIGGNVSYNPGYSTRLSAEQLTTISQKRVMDLYGLWRVDSSTAWRLTLSNLDPRNYNTGSDYNGNGVVENSYTQNRSWTNVQILLEKKL